MTKQKLDKYHRNSKGVIKLFLSSICHLVKHYEENLQNEELTSFFSAIPRNAKILSGQDFNDKVGILSKIFLGVLGHHGRGNYNMKGKDLLFLLKIDKF